MVYVDNACIPYGSMLMCHLAADSTDELLRMVDRIGVHRKWLQHPGAWDEHFDVCLAKRRLAIRHGAQPVTRRELMAYLRARRAGFEGLQ